MRQKDQVYFKKIDFVFYNRGKIKRAVEEARIDKGNKSSKGSGVSDPTAAVVLNNLSPLRFVVIDGRRLEYPERWLKLVDLVYAKATEMGRELLDGLYIRQESSRKTYERVNIEQSTFSRYWRDLRHVQELYAVPLGLIRVL